MIRRFLRLDRRVPVVLRMRRREVPAAERGGVVFLLAVIGQRLARNLTSGDAAAVRKGGQEQRVDGSQLLQVVEHFVRAFVDERHGACLNPDHGWSQIARGGLGNQCTRGEDGRGFEKFAAIHGRFPHGPDTVLKPDPTVQRVCRSDSESRRNRSTGA